MVQYVLIPADAAQPLKNLSYHVDDSDHSTALPSGDLLPHHLAAEARSSSDTQSNEDTEQVIEYEVVPLRRMSDQVPGVYAYFRRQYDNRATKQPNIRATCLLMSTGQHSKRFYGDVYIGRYGRDTSPTGNRKVRNLDLFSEEIHWGCVSPDLRLDILRKVGKMSGEEVDHEQVFAISIPDWLKNASRENYRDSIQISALAAAFDAKNDEGNDDSSSSSSSDDEESTETSSDDESSSDSEDERTKLRNVTLCLHCRGPTQALCRNCEGAYFCKDSRPCWRNGWSHQCLCNTWKVYVEQREELSTFPFAEWHRRLMGRDCQISDSTYRSYLSDELKVLGNESGSWWDTEVDGWAAGLSGSAQRVDASIRRSYSQGFILDASLIPPERHITDEDCVAAKIARDVRGLPILDSWSDYYNLRGIPLTSPVALLCTFPLTIFYALQKWGEVPITVAKMLGRKLRIHAVGIEKEMNFLDLFSELAYLLPQDLEIELTFIVRQDMLPPKCRTQSHQAQGHDMKVDLASNLTLLVKSGTYGDELNPLFGDVGTGPPDMLIGLNAGLFAYKSWSSVVTFCHDNPSVVAVFTDYNAHSGVNCAGLGGGKARESLTVNPFRQPLAMPVFCFNLPQFSNGFLYVFNEQQLDE